MSVYQPYAPAAILPADGRASKLRVYNPLYNSANPQSAFFADFDFSEERFSLNTHNARGQFFIASTLVLLDLTGVSGEAAGSQKTFFDWLTVYQAKAVTEAQEFIGEEKTRAEDAEGLLGGRITEEKTRAEGAEGVLRADIVSANTAISSANTAIANILNGSPEHLNQLTEIVADYTANGATVTTALQAEATFARAEAADLRARVAALETLVANLVNSA